jgi:hypothetical protein
MIKLLGDAKSVWSLRLLFLTGVLGMLATGCKTYEQQNTVMSHWERGDLPNAVLDANAKADANAENKDAVIWALEQGAVLRAAGRYEDSNQAFDKAQAKIDDFAQKAKVRVGQESEAMLVNQAELSYEGRSYDGIMLNTYKALNYLSLGEPDKARPELIKAYHRQQDAVEDNKRRIERAQKEAEKRRQKAGNGSADDKTQSEAIDKAQSDPKLQSELSGATANLDTVKTYADYVNPFTVYLDGLYFMANAADASDLERAHKSFQRVTSFTSGSDFAKQDLAATEDLMRGKPLSPVTYVIFETGRAPSRGQYRIDIPIIVSKVSYVGAAIPKLQFHDNFIPNLSVSAGGANTGTALVASMDGIVAHDFKNELPLVITKTITSTVIKTIASYAANTAAKNAGGDLAELGSKLFTGIYQATVNIADERTWSTLPKEFQVARIPTPEDRKIDLTAPNGMKSSITVGDGKINVVYVKSINSATPLIVSQFKLK